MGDDGIGIFAARALKEELKMPLFDIEETHEAGLSLLDRISGYKKAVIIDSISTGKAKPGNIYKFTQDDFKSAKEPYSSHRIGLAAILEMARKYNVDAPEELIIYAVEIEKSDTFCDRLTPKAGKALKKLVTLIKKDLFVE